MRHKETRVITNLADLNNHSKLESYIEGQSKLAPKLGQELLYNINLKTEQQDQELARLSRNLSVETKKWNMLQEERMQHGTQSEEHEERLHHLTKLLSVLERVNVLIAPPDSTSSPSVITLEAVIQLMQTLYDNFPKEFTIFGLIDLLPDLLSRTADLSQQEWQPLSHSQSSHLLVGVAAPAKSGLHCLLSSQTARSPCWSARPPPFSTPHWRPSTCQPSAEPSATTGRCCSSPRSPVWSCCRPYGSFFRRRFSSKRWIYWCCPASPLQCWHGDRSLTLLRTPGCIRGCRCCRANSVQCTLTYAAR
mmetsp:Transcript_31076/g.42486  ORF Transcript_31076/g.42486 Transcript_31076/m.42486 type:complete len:306 (+) Transcript_31076:709-1626(+)